MPDSSAGLVALPDQADFKDAMNGSKLAVGEHSSIEFLLVCDDRRVAIGRPHLLCTPERLYGTAGYAVL